MCRQRRGGGGKQTQWAKFGFKKKWKRRCKVSSCAETASISTVWMSKKKWIADRAPSFTRPQRWLRIVSQLPLTNHFSTNPYKANWDASELRIQGFCRIVTLLKCWGKTLSTKDSLLLHPTRHIIMARTRLFYKMIINVIHTSQLFEFSG